MLIAAVVGCLSATMFHVSSSIVGNHSYVENPRALLVCLLLVIYDCLIDFVITCTIFK